MGGSVAVTIIKDGEYFQMSRWTTLIMQYHKQNYISIYMKEHPEDDNNTLKFNISPMDQAEFEYWTDRENRTSEAVCDKKTKNTHRLKIDYKNKSNGSLYIPNELANKIKSGEIDELEFIIVVNKKSFE